MRIDRYFWLRLALLGFLLGVLTTIGVAWMLARSHDWAPWEYGTIAEPPAGPVMIHSLKRRGSEMVALFPLPPSGAEPLEPRRLDWSTARRRGRQSGIAIESACGWPFLCLSWQARATDPDRFWIHNTMRWGLTLKPGNYTMTATDKRVIGGRPVISKQSQSFSGLGELVLPLRPLWGRFMLNTLLYCLLWFVPIMLFTLFVWRIRMRRGRCPCCNYPVLDIETCPECGREVTGEASVGPVTDD